MTFQAPVWLWLLAASVALVGLYIAVQLRRKKFAARFTNVDLLSRLIPKRPGWRRHVAFGLLVLALATFTVALAKPSAEVQVPRERATVIMAVDVSLSMEADDIAPNRFEAMKVAAKDFVDILPERINLGLVSFAGTATPIVTPSIDRAAIKTALDNLELDEATAIGEAIFASLAVLDNFQATLESTGNEAPPARIVLLSDGYNTVGRENSQAIDAARDAGVPVSTIAFGTDYGTVEIEGEQQPVPVDSESLRQIAEETGGTFKEAASAAELTEVYEDLGSQIGYVTEPREVTPWFIGSGLALAFLGAILSLLWTNRLL